MPKKHHIKFYNAKRTSYSKYAVSKNIYKMSNLSKEYIRKYNKKYQSCLKYKILSQDVQQLVHDKHVDQLCHFLQIF